VLGSWKADQAGRPGGLEAGKPIKIGGEKVKSFKANF